jgi:hypothetical protein
LSRVQLQTVTSDSTAKLLTDWLKLSYQERIAEIDTHIKAKDTLWVQAIKNELQSHIRNRTASVDSLDLKEIQLIIENLLTRGASNKMLLEHLALTMPLTR